ncbi:MAG: hypothetical protein NTV88_00245, partial [Candidatus Micrarchaeota archaeon]|nr:hypothetical protein [Candidatus Micrarchaeota archaeon]
MMKVRKGSFAVALLLALVIFGSAIANSATFFGFEKTFTQINGDQCTSNTTFDVWGLIGISFVCLVLGTMVAALGWTLSGVASSQKYNDFVRSSVWGFVEGIGILSIFSLAFAGLYEFGSANIDKARTYATVIRNTMVADFSTVLLVSTVFSFLATINPQFRPSGAKLGFMFTFQLGPMFRPVFDLLGTLIQAMVAAVVEWFGHKFILCFIKDNMLTILFPAGVFLRSFGIRAGGNALIGIALALFFVYPYMMIQAGEIATDHYQTELDPSENLLGGTACIGKPICCLPVGAPSSLDDQRYIKNGPNWETDLSDRISIDKVLEGPVYTDFSGTSPPATSVGGFCFYNTGAGRFARGALNTFTGGNSYSLTGGTAGLFGGAAALAAIMKYMNTSMIAGALMLPSIGLVLAFFYD